MKSDQTDFCESRADTVESACGFAEGMLGSLILLLPQPETCFNILFLHGNSWYSRSILISSKQNFGTRKISGDGDGALCEGASERFSLQALASSSFRQGREPSEPSASLLARHCDNMHTTKLTSHLQPPCREEQAWKQIDLAGSMGRNC